MQEAVWTVSRSVLQEDVDVTSLPIQEIKSGGDSSEDGITAR